MSLSPRTQPYQDDMVNSGEPSVVWRNSVCGVYATKGAWAERRVAVAFWRGGGKARGGGRRGTRRRGTRAWWRREPPPNYGDGRAAEKKQNRAQVTSKSPQVTSKSPPSHFRNRAQVIAWPRQSRFQVTSKSPPSHLQVTPKSHTLISVDLSLLCNTGNRNDVAATVRLEKTGSFLGGAFFLVRLGARSRLPRGPWCSSVATMSRLHNAPSSTFAYSSNCIRNSSISNRSRNDSSARSSNIGCSSRVSRAARPDYIAVPAYSGLANKTTHAIFLWIGWRALLDCRWQSRTFCWQARVRALRAAPSRPVAVAFATSVLAIVAVASAAPVTVASVASSEAAVPRSSRGCDTRPAHALHSQVHLQK